MMIRERLKFEVNRRAARGASFLDEIRPGWADAIDLDRIRMAQCDQCILGQLWGWYGTAVIELGIKHRAFELGFTECPDVESGPPLELWKSLADAWRAEVRKRTGTGVAP